MTQEEALAKRATDIQSNLDRWVKRSNLFPVGTRITASLQLRRVPLMMVKPGKPAVLSWKGRETPCYVYESSTLSKQEWESILRNPFSPMMKGFFLQLRARGNRPTPAQVDGSTFSAESVCVELKARNLKFRLVPIVYVKEKLHWLVQLYRVSPKKGVRKHWKTK